MPQFSLQIDQSLLDKTLDQLKPYPYTVIRFPRQMASEYLFPEFEVADVLPDVQQDFGIYGDQTLDLLDQEAASLLDSDNETPRAELLGAHTEGVIFYEENSREYRFLYNEARHLELLSSEYGSLSPERMVDSFYGIKTVGPKQEE